MKTRLSNDAANLFKFQTLDFSTLYWKFRQIKRFLTFWFSVTIRVGTVGTLNQRISVLYCNNNNNIKLRGIVFSWVASNFKFQISSIADTNK